MIESSLQTQKIKLIEDHLPSFFTALDAIPTHPPYAAMIMEAIRDLNEEGGSNVEAISKYIETNYEDLPWAHPHLLKHHLGKPVENGEVISSSNSCYLLPNPNPKNEHKQLRWKSRPRPGRAPKNHVPEENLLARTEIIGSSSDESDCLMELGNSSKCESKGNVVVGTELIRSLCDEDDCLIELGNNNDCESEGNIVVGTETVRSSCDEGGGLMVLVNSSVLEEFVERTEMIGSLCDEADCLIELSNNSDCEPEGNFVLGTEIVRSSCDEVDRLMVLGSSNELEPKEEFIERTVMIGSLCDEDDCLMELGNSSKCVSADLNKPTTVAKPYEWKNEQCVGGGSGEEEGTKLEWRGHNLGLNQVNFDDSTVPAPVCSCTGVLRQCYKRGKWGWQSACCTNTLSMYPLPVMPNKRYNRLGGRKLSDSAFNKLLSRLAAEGHDLSTPLDLKDHWARHGTNGYSTVPVPAVPVCSCTGVLRQCLKWGEMGMAIHLLHYHFVNVSFA